MKNKQIFLDILFLILLSGLLRLYDLGKVPSGMANDEVGYIYNAYSVFKTGRNIYGRFLPWTTQIGVPFMPVPTYLIAPFVGVLGLNPFSGRLPNALSGVVQVSLVYLLCIKLFRSKKIALFSSVAFSISPWHLQLTRSAYDPVSGLLFYLLAVTSFLYFVDKKKLLFLSAIPLFLAAYSYRAMNIIFVPVVLSLLWYSWSVSKKERRKVFFFFFGVVMIVLSLFHTYFFQGRDYTTEVFSSSDSPLNFSKATEIVDSEIRHSAAPILLARIFSNKFLYALRIFRENYLGAFSTMYLFTAGEAQPIYAIWWRGMLYIIELPLLIFGLIYLYKKSRRGTIFIILSILIGPLPSALSGTTYGARAFYLLPFLMVAVGGGIAFFFEQVWRLESKVKYLLLFAFVSVYSFQFAGYLYQYYARYSIYGAEAWFRSVRDLSEYVARVKEERKQVIVSNAINFEVLQYAFWNEIDPRVIQKVLSEGQKDGQFVVDNLVFKESCLDEGTGDPHVFLSSDVTYITRANCHREYQPDEEIRRYKGRFKDGEIIWKIYHGKKTDI